MSPHVRIGEAIDRLAMHCTAETDRDTESLIVAHFTAGDIDADEFKHYCERVRRISERCKEAA